LVNSDGLSNMISSQTICDIVLSDKTVAAKTQELIAAANDAGGQDNITVILVAYSEEDN
ncbi:PP2C family protein-serine/threonine phosphatase, partial [Streptococcus pluranimalium]